MKTIAVFGSAMVQPDQPDFVAAYEVGKALASAGFEVMTGGYAGVMGAASQGAGEVGGHVIGVTTGAVERLRGPELHVNKWVVDKIHYDSLHERLMHLVRDADGYVVMPGGLGTLTELSMAWELMRTRDIPMRPIVCFGRYWGDVLSVLKTSPYVRESDWQTLTFADTPTDIVNIFKGAFEKDESSS